MSQQNVEIARRLWEKVQDGVARGDPGAWFDSDAVAGDLEWILPAPLDGKSVWRGVFDRRVALEAAGLSGTGTVRG
jgi:hypothetical protein